MVYFKSLLVGIVALVLAVPLVTFILATVFSFFRKVPPGSNDTSISWDLRMLVLNSPISWIFWAAAIVIFGVGFYWEFRRASH